MRGNKMTEAEQLYGQRLQLAIESVRVALKQAVDAEYDGEVAYNDSHITRLGKCLAALREMHQEVFTQPSKEDK